MKMNSKIHWLLAILSIAMQPAGEVRSDETKDIWEWNQRDFRHENGTGDFTWHSNEDAAGNPVDCDIIQDFHELVFPFGMWVGPGYYRLVVETRIDQSAGIATPNNDLINTIEIWTATAGTPGAYVDPLQIEWIKPKPAGDNPYLRQYFRGSFPTGYYDVSPDDLLYCALKCLNFCSSGLPLSLCRQCLLDCSDSPYIPPTSFYQTGTFFIDHASLFWFIIHATANARFNVGRVWLYRNVDPDPGSLKILSWNVDEQNDKNIAIGRALADYLNSPDLAVFQELSHDKRKTCEPGIYDKENCILGIMEGYAEGSGLHVGWSGGLPDYGFSDGDFYNIYGTGNWTVEKKNGRYVGHADHYLGMIIKKSAWLEYLDDPAKTYAFTNKGVGPDGDKHHGYGFGTYNCTDRKDFDCWHCPWPAKNMEEDHDHVDCCGVDSFDFHYNNDFICRNNFYFTNDNQVGCTYYKHMNGRHITARFSDKMGKEGAIANTHLIHGDDDAGCIPKEDKTPGSFRKRTRQMLDIIDHIATNKTYYVGTIEKKIMYGSDFFENHPFVIAGDTNLRYDEQYLILDYMRSKLSSLGANSAVLDLTLSHNLQEADTHPGSACEDTGDKDVFDKIYLIGSAASMDNDIEFQIGDFLMINGSCCHPEDRACGCANSPEECREAIPPEYTDFKRVDSSTGHFPVFATLSGRTTDSIGNIIIGFSVDYSAEEGEAPDFDMKFEWETCLGCVPYLLGESRYGLYPFYVHPDVELYPDGIEGMAATFGGEGYVLFPHFGDVNYFDEEIHQRRLTIEVWLKPDIVDPGYEHTVLVKGRSSLPSYMLDIIGAPLFENEGYIRFSLWDHCSAWTATSPGPTYPEIEAGKWHHVLVSWDGLVVKTIVKKINGISDVETTLWEEVLGQNLAMCEEAGPLQIGARFVEGGFDNYFVGEMDDLQIYNDVAR